MEALLEFSCQGYRFALPLTAVRCVLPSAQPTPLPGAPDIVLGALHLGGKIFAIANFHRRVGLAYHGITLAQHLILVDVDGEVVGWMVDQVIGVATGDVDDEMTLPEMFRGSAFVQAVLLREGELCVVCDPAALLCDAERILLQDAFERFGHARP